MYCNIPEQACAHMAFCLHHELANVAGQCNMLLFPKRGNVKVNYVCGSQVHATRSSGGSKGIICSIFGLVGTRGNQLGCSVRSLP